MLLRVDPDEALPVYEQLRQQLLLMVVSGALQPGTKLPTIRQLALDLGIAKGTVSKVYDSLFHEGVIEGNRRHGTVVAEGHGVPEKPGFSASVLRDAALKMAVTVVQAGIDPAEAHRLLDDAIATLARAR